MGNSLRADLGMFCVAAILAAMPHAAKAADLELKLSGAAEDVYRSPQDGCTPDDIPDVAPRAYRDERGGVTMFALHFINRPLRGPDLNHLKIDCHVALDSPLDPDPAHYADRFFLASTWTRDGHTVSALVHHEYHADQHERCRFQGDLPCWYNTILAFSSHDGGEDFTKANPLVIASAPFTQSTGQGRHRGFFEPSNMFSDGKFTYVFASTTGWTGQAAGSCLFRTPDPAKPALWRAYDGSGFSISYSDPYKHPSDPLPCQVIAPFTFSVGAVVRHARSHLWLAVLQASPTALYPADGIYYASSADLLHWSEPRLLIAGKTLYGDLCQAGRFVINYPSLLDPSAPGRNFDTIGDHPFLYVTKMDVKDCQTGARVLLRQRADITIREGR